MILKNLFTFAEKFFIRRNKLLFAKPALPPVGLLTTGHRGDGLKVVTIEIIEIVTTIFVTTFKRCNNLNML